METEGTGAAPPDQSTGARDDYGERNGWRGDTRTGADRTFQWPVQWLAQWPPSFSVLLAASRASRLGSRSRVRRKHSAMV